MKELKYGSGIDVIITKVGKETFLLKGDYCRLWQSLKENNYNKVIAQSINLSEATCLRLLNKLLSHNLIESKRSTELKQEEVPEQIRELVKNKDMRSIFYFIKAKEIKDLSNNSQINKKLEKIELTINNLSNPKISNSLNLLKTSIFLLSFSSVLIGLLIYYNALMISTIAIAPFIMATCILILTMIITGIILSIKTIRELLLNSK
jgi:predicted RND superfamily exporter protein